MKFFHAECGFSYVKRVYLDRMFVKGPTTVKKIVVNVCRDCGNSFRGHSGSYRCPECRKKEEQYKAQREKMRRALPYYLRTGS